MSPGVETVAGADPILIPIGMAVLLIWILFKLGLGANGLR